MGGKRFQIGSAIKSDTLFVQSIEAGRRRVSGESGNAEGRYAPLMGICLVLGVMGGDLRSSLWLQTSYQTKDPNAVTSQQEVDDIAKGIYVRIDRFYTNCGGIFTKRFARVCLPFCRSY